MTWIGTFSGAKVDFLNPDPKSICIEDIARGLSRVNRFVGQTTEPYTVAQHSVLASRLVPPHLAGCALLHDATEAYMGDCSRPLKQLLGKAWDEIENRLHQAITDAIGEAYYYSAQVKAVDDRLLITERNVLQPNHADWEWGEDIEPYSPNDVPIVPWSAPLAEASFLERYRALYPSKTEHAG